MGNTEHLEILKKGVDDWNQWRTLNTTIRPDLHEAHLSSANLSSANLRGADLSRANLRGAILRGADLSRANLVRAYLRRADLSEADLKVADLKVADLSRANLIRANLSKADLSKANLSKANLIRAELSEANLRVADLSRAELSEANLSKANLIRANLYGAILSKTDFHSSSTGWTIFANVDLSLAEGLETVNHLGPSSIGIDTIYRSGGKIPEVFLRGVGVPDSLITYIDSLTKEAIDYYSCFISYSTLDQSFAERLHTDLQNKGVRCWFAPEDIRIGDKFRQSIDEAIRYYDKLLLVLSKNSIQSNWVEKEVETAFEKEQRRKKLVLFPVRLDDSVMETDQAWAADIRRTRHIGDFRGWKNHDAYQNAFDRLLRDLKEAV